MSPRELIISNQDINELSEKYGARFNQVEHRRKSPIKDAFRAGARSVLRTLGLIDCDVCGRFVPRERCRYGVAMVETWCFNCVRKETGKDDGLGYPWVEPGDEQHDPPRAP